MRSISIVVFCAVTIGCTAARDVLPPWTESSDEVNLVETKSERASTEPIAILPRPEGLDPRLVKLGGRLFFDPRLSLDGRIACATCHDVSSGGGDGLRFSTGLNDTVGFLNAPTVLNVSLNVAQFWDGRALTLEDQAARPLANPAEMGRGLLRGLSVAKRDPYYSRAFAELFADGINEENVLRAIAIYERSLVTTGSRFDQWLGGDDDALSQEEKEGYFLFKSVGCIACHQGRNVGGNMFQKFGILRNYFKDRGKINPADLGRFNVTGKDEDKHVFKVPSLRSVALTAPYFHDGSVATLGEAIQIMGRYQLGRELQENEIEKIEAFLETLLGDIPDTSAYQQWATEHMKMDS
ncbi:MAG: cytochrome-c peroxidase [Myxococcales bacterium]|nr:cytochrome-c peroxidase [Myxococcales bacterium]